MSIRTLFSSRLKQVLLFLIWGAGVAFGFYELHAYSVTPGSVGPSLPMWPQNSRLAKPPDASLLVIFMHPECSCSRATLSSVELLKSRLGKRLAVDFVFYGRADSKSATQNELRQRAAAIEDAKSFDDEGGELAKRFGAETSGQTYLYDPSGHLVYEGGLTASRAHEGPSLGSESIENFVLKGQTRVVKAASFGCAIKKRFPSSAATR